MIIRKLITIIEETLEEAGQQVAAPVRRAAAAAVIENPCAGPYQDDLSELFDIGEELGGLLGRRAVAALTPDSSEIHSFGKAAVVGEDGEIEHAAAILHPKMGAPLRAAVGGGKAIVPSTAKRGAMGTAIDIPLHFKNAAFVRSHFDAMEVRVPDAPRRDEIVVIAVATVGGRPLPRIGGLQASDIAGEDGLR